MFEIINLIEDIINAMDHFIYQTIYINPEPYYINYYKALPQYDEPIYNNLPTFNQPLEAPYRIIPTSPGQELVKSLLK